MPSASTSTMSVTTLTTSPAAAAGKTRVVTFARPAIVTKTRNSPYSAQPSATQGNASCAAKNSSSASSRTTQRPSSVTPATTSPVVTTYAEVTVAYTRRASPSSAIEYASGGQASWKPRTATITTVASFTATEYSPAAAGLSARSR